MVVEIKHVDGCSVGAPSYADLTVEHRLATTWSDWSAQVPRSPLPPIQLHTLFKDSAAGPYTYNVAQGTASQEFVAICTLELQHYGDAKKSIPPNLRPTP